MKNSGINNKTTGKFFLSKIDSFFLGKKKSTKLSTLDLQIEWRSKIDKKKILSLMVHLAR